MAATTELDDTLVRVASMKPEAARFWADNARRAGKLGRVDVWTLLAMVFSHIRPDLATGEQAWADALDHWLRTTVEGRRWAGLVATSPSLPHGARS